MAYSEVGICNAALGRIGAGRIVSLSDASNEARNCVAVYEMVRDEVLEAFPWTFAKARKQLSRYSTSPVFGYGYAYTLPADCLRVIEVAETGVGKPTWVVEGGYLLTDLEEVYIAYITRVTDPTKYSPAFVNVMAARLAADLAMSVARNGKLANEMLNVYVSLLRQARGLDGKTDSAAETVAEAAVGYASSRN